MAYDNIKLEKGLYTTGKSFTGALEELDPSENYIGTELEGLDAYQRQLKRFDIKVSGKGSDTVSKFFNTTDSSALFPEYVSRAVRQGIEEADSLDKVIATTTVIDSLDYRAIESVPTEDEKELSDVGEGAFIPETVVRTKESLTPLKKRGRMLVASYEALKFQKLDLFTVTLRQIGAYISRCQLADAISTLCDDIPIVEMQGTSLEYRDILNLWNEIDPYRMNTLIIGNKSAVDLLDMPEFKDSNAGLDFHGTGKLLTPLGADMVRSSLLNNENVIIGLDRSCAVEKVQAGEVITDFDKLIDRQLERATITTITGFSKIFSKASAMLQYA